MSIRKQKKRHYPLVDLLLILIVATLYVATGEQDSLAVMAGVYQAPVYRGREQGKAAIEIPVTWDAKALKPMLDELHARGVSVTFAVSGEWAERNPDMLRRMAAEGHELATAGYSPGEDGNLSFIMKDIAAASTIMEGITGCAPSLYYSGGRSLSVSSRAAKKLSMTHVLCTVDLMCARGSGADIVARLPEEPTDGSIILLEPTAAALEALEQIISTLEERGVTLTTVSGVTGLE